jgi:hypothetical protein
MVRFAFLDHGYCGDRTCVKGNPGNPAGLLRSTLTQARLRSESEINQEGEAEKQSGLRHFVNSRGQAKSANYLKAAGRRNTPERVPVKLRFPSISAWSPAVQLVSQQLSIEVSRRHHPHGEIRTRASRHI